MKQQLGTEYTANTPLSAIISNRLVELQQAYTGSNLLGGIVRLKRDKSLKASTFKKSDYQYWIDLHLNNLCETYGQSKVIEVYNMIYSINLEKKAI